MVTAATETAPQPDLDLARRVRALLTDAAEVYARTPWSARLLTARGDLGGPLRVALVGRVKSGKSTLLNALLGTPVAATDAGECTRVVTWYSWGERHQAWGLPWSAAGSAEGDEPQRQELPLRRQDDRIVLDLGARGADELARIDVELPAPELSALTLVDTPGLASLSPGLGGRTTRYLEGEVGPAPDAVIYLMRQLHVGDVNFLEAFRGPHHRMVPPVHALGVLSRADEVGGGRPDSLELAAGLAERYAEDPRVRPLVQTVLPVAGLLAEAAATLTEAEHAELAALAGLPDAVTAPMLLSAARFGASRRFLPVPEDRRRRLLDRLGLVGVRRALAELRDGAGRSRDELAAGLIRASGLDRLRCLLQSRFTTRRDVLKAEAALRLIEQAVARSPLPGGRRLLAQTERLRVGVHDFEELRVLNDLRSGRLRDEDDLARMERLLGAHGGAPAQRLGLEPDPSTQALAQALKEEHRYWQALALDPLSSPQLVRVAAVLQRTCEGIRRAARS